MDQTIASASQQDILETSTHNPSQAWLGCSTRLAWRNSRNHGQHVRSFLGHHSCSPKLWKNWGKWHELQNSELKTQVLLTASDCGTSGRFVCKWRLLETEFVPSNPKPCPAATGCRYCHPKCEETAAVAKGTGGESWGFPCGQRENSSEKQWKTHTVHKTSETAVSA